MSDKTFGIIIATLLGAALGLLGDFLWGPLWIW